MRKVSPKCNRIGALRATSVFRFAPGRAFRVVHFAQAVSPQGGSAKRHLAELDFVE